MGGRFCMYIDTQNEDYIEVVDQLMEQLADHRFNLDANIDVDVSYGQITAVVKQCLYDEIADLGYEPIYFEHELESDAFELCSSGKLIGLCNLDIRTGQISAEVLADECAINSNSLDLDHYDAIFIHIKNLNLHPKFRGLKIGSEFMSKMGTSIADKLHDSVQQIFDETPQLLPIITQAFVVTDGGERVVSEFYDFLQYQLTQQDDGDLQYVNIPDF
jgi:ribosomal protein S18 acetylase RimI-like enzyme